MYGAIVVAGPLFTIFSIWIVPIIRGIGKTIYCITTLYVLLALLF